MTLHPQFIVDAEQCRQAVILPIDEWQQVLEELEELDDIRAYDEAKAESQEAVPWPKAVREIQEGNG